LLSSFSDAELVAAGTALGAMAKNAAARRVATIRFICRPVPAKKERAL
jgi:hypothetical protein